MTVIDPAEPLLEKFTPEVQSLVQQLRKLIKDVMPQATETVYLGWANIHYRAGEKMRDTIVSINPLRSYVNIEFGDGVDLPDPAHRLEGAGKRLRHVKIRGENDMNDPEVRVLLEAAARRRGL